MFCCKPDTLRYYTINLDPNLVLFEEEPSIQPLQDKFNQLKHFQYLPKNMLFSSELQSQIISTQDAPSPFSDYQLTFSDQTLEIIFKQLTPNPISKLWRVLIANQSETLNEGDEFSFDGFNFQLYHLPKPKPSLSNQITTLSDPQEKCRICFGNQTSQLNPILSFCQCSGSIKYMHLECCREWIQEGSETMEGALYAMHVYNHGECNICKQPWKTTIRHNKKEYLLYDFEPTYLGDDDPILNPEQTAKLQNIIFILYTNDEEYESEEGLEGHYVFIFKLRLPQVINYEEEYSYKIGKSFEECDIVFEHMMIGSPLQCEFKFKNNKLTIKDLNSNDGTNVLMKSSQKKQMNTKEGLFFRYMDTVYWIRGEKYLFSCFEPNISYTIKYEDFKEVLPVIREGQ